MRRDEETKKENQEIAEGGDIPNARWLGRKKDVSGPCPSTKGNLAYVSEQMVPVQGAAGKEVICKDDQDVVC